jgi:hypothetical protein
MAQFSPSLFVGAGAVDTIEHLCLYTAPFSDAGFLHTIVGASKVSFAHSVAELVAIGL